MQLIAQVTRTLRETRLRETRLRETRLRETRLRPRNNIVAVDKTRALKLLFLSSCIS